jgi:hypothetical protein
MVRDAEERKKRTQNHKGKATDETDENGGPDLEQISSACDGLARAIIPMIRTLHDGPGSLANL